MGKKKKKLSHRQEFLQIFRELAYIRNEYKDRKYMWLSSAGKYMGASSGSPVHFVGEPGAKTIFVTEGPLKGDVANALTGRSFVCVPGVNQYASLAGFLKKMKADGTEVVYEAYDMDKLLKPVCRGDYNETCLQCECYGTYYREQEKGLLPTKICSRKKQKRDNIQRGCKKVREICKALNLTYSMLTWDKDKDGDWAEHAKGIDDFLLLQKQNKN